MATINHGSGADIIVPSSNGTTYRGLAGDDTYIISNSIEANAAITIVDTSGANKIQLVDGLSVSSSKFAADAVQLTLSNGAVITVNGASNFTFDVGGNATTGTSGSSNTLAQFASAMGVASLPSSGSTAGSSDITIANNGVSGSAAPTFTVTKDATSVTEGSSVTFTITASSAVSADTSFSWTVIGDDNGGTVDKAGTTDIDVLSGTATIASGATSTTFVVTPTADGVVEGIEGIQVSVFDANSAALSSATILVNNGGSSATSESFTLTTGVNTFTGRSGNDSFDATTEASLNDFDVLDGGDGVDTLTLQRAAGDTGTTLIPQLSNMEVIQVTNSATADSGNDDGEVLTIATAGLTGITKVVNIAGGSEADGVTFNDLAAPTDVEIRSGKGVTTVNHNATALTGAADSITVTLSGTDSSTLAITDDSTSAAVALETVTIDSISVANTLADLQLDTVNTTTLNVTGSTRLTITAALDSTVATVDASGSSGGLTLTNAPAATVLNITGSSGADILTAIGAGSTTLSLGAGNDSVDFNANFTGADIVDGGAGTDTLIVSGGAVSNAGLSSTLFGGVSNVEVIKVDTAHTLTLAQNEVFDTVDISDGTSQTVNFDDGYTKATTVKMSGDTGDTINNNANIDLTVSANSGDLTGDTNITGSLGTNDTLNILNAADATTTFDTNNDVFETINVISYTLSATPAIDTGSYSLALGTGVLTINAAGLTATEAFTLTGGSTATPMDVTAGPGADILTLGTKADTLDAGAGNDNITATAGSNVIDAGAGNDTIALGSGADNIDGGAGNDIITAAAALGNTDIIDGGAGTDTLTTTAAISSATVMGGVSNIEIIDPIGGINITATGDMGGATTFLANDAGAQIITLGGVGLTWTPDTVYSVTAGTETNNKAIVNSANVNLTVKQVMADLDAAQTITGGTGTDIVELTADGGSGDADDVTKVEKIIIKDSLTAAGSDATLVVNENITLAQQPAGLTIDASELDGSTVTAADERFTLTGDGSAIPLNVIGGGGADALDGGTVNDTIAGGDGADTIDGNEGLDNMSGGAGNDTFTLNAKTEYVTAYGTDIIDGGAGTDTVTFTGAQNLSAAQLATISNTESWTIPTGSDFTLSDTVLANNPGLTFNFAGNGTLSTGEDTAGASLMSTAINLTATTAGNLKIVGSSGDDTFSFDKTEVLNNSDTIDGNAGTDIIYIVNDDERAGVNNYGVGDATAATVGSNLTNVEKIVITDTGADDSAGDVTVTIASGLTSLALEVDASALDANVSAPTTTGERAVITNNDNVALTAKGGGFSDSITGGSGADIIHGNGGADTLLGGAGNDVIEGGAGVDSITGGAGVDHIKGGDGNDIIIVADDASFKVSGGVETVDGGAGTDTLSFTENAALTLTAPELGELVGVEKIALAGASAQSLTFGNATFEGLGNTSLTITTTTGNSTTSIDGSAVSNGTFLIIDDGSNTNTDTLIGGSGDDIFRFSSTTGLTSDDSVKGNGGTDTIQIDNTSAVTVDMDFNNVTTVEQVTVYTSATTGLTSGALDIQIAPHSTAALNVGSMTVDLSGKNVGSATFNVNSSLDTIGIDFTITGGTASDQLIGSAGDDTISGGGTTTGDTLTGGSGNDSITGNSGNDTLAGGTGNDVVNGGAGVDGINGNAGNDTIDGGDGVDTIEGDAGADNLTGGAGNDIFKYDTITDSSGSTRDTITDFKQSTLSATTGAQITNGDSISLIVSSGNVANGNTTSFILADKGDVNNAGEAVNAMNNSKGSFVFSKDNDTLYIDMDGDSTLNSDDYAFTLTDLDSFHGADIDVTVSGEDTDATTITTLDGNDIITTGSGADTITSGGGADIIVAAAGNNTVTSGAGADNISVAGAGADIINAGAGNDTVTLGTGAGDDIVTLGTGDDSLVATAVVASTQKVVVTDFEDAGDTVGDTVTLANSLTTLSSTGTATVEAESVTVLSANGAYSLGGAMATNTNALDIVILSGGNETDANLANDFADENGDELLKYLAANGVTTSHITVDNNADKLLIIAYDGGEAFLYSADAGAGNAQIANTELKPLIHFDSQVGTFVAADFVMA